MLKKKQQPLKTKIMETNKYIKMADLRQMKNCELAQLAIKRKYATAKEVIKMTRADMLARIMRLQLNTKQN